MVVSTACLMAAALYLTYLMLGVILGGLALDAAALTTEVRWLPPVLACLALGMLRAPEAAQFVLSVRRWVGIVLTASPMAIPLYAGALRGGAEYWGLSSSHHIPGITAGGYLLLLGATRSLAAPTRVERYAMVPAGLAVLLLSQSRVSMLAIGLVAAAGALSHAVKQGRWRRVVLVLGVLVLAVAASPRLRETIIWFGSQDTFGAISTAYSGQAPPSSLTSAEHNVVDRFYLFGLAIRDFQEHWLLGIGPGRFNDRASAPQVDLGPGPWPPTEEVFTVARSEMTAHNMFVQIAVEMGLFGLVIFMALSALWLVGRHSSTISRFLVLQGVSSGALISIAATTPWLAVALLVPRAVRHAAEP